ncbi:hypothetical protein, partial [Mesonia sp. K4-1]|uniref:hypothetical protein n=1 Tax=Mesonia sp. K4-1 TaxID=2602760 RepID=UPI00164FFE45
PNNPQSGSNPGGGGAGHGNNEDPSNTTITNPIPCYKVNADCPELVVKDPCEKLNDLIQDDTANNGLVPNIKPTLENLKTTLSQPGENGAQFKKNNGSYSNVNLPATTGNSISITAGGDSYGAAHTHPFSTFPMFSWSDVYTLFNLHWHSEADIKGDVTFILIAYPTLASAQPNVYSITVDNFNAFRSKINANLNAIVAERKDLTMTSPLKDKIEALNEKLGEEYRADTNYEKVFLEQFGDHNISMYKANEDITDWSELELNESLGTVFETPCN